MIVQLTVADHEKNGFVALAIWPRLSLDAARRFIERVDASVPADAEPCTETAPFWFILDLVDADGDMIDNSKKCLPTQTAMRLAPEQVQAWLTARPDPDSVLGAPIPVLPLQDVIHSLF